MHHLQSIPGFHASTEQVVVGQDGFLPLQCRRRWAGTCHTSIAFYGTTLQLIDFFLIRRLAFRHWFINSLDIFGSIFWSGMCGEDNPRNCPESRRFRGERRGYNIQVIIFQKHEEFFPLSILQEEWGCQLLWSPVDLWGFDSMFLCCHGKVHLPWLGSCTYCSTSFYSSTEGGVLIPSWRLSKLPLRLRKNNKVTLAATWVLRSLSAAAILGFPPGSSKNRFSRAHFKLFFQSCQKVENSWSLLELEGTMAIIHAHVSILFIFPFVCSSNRNLLNIYYIQALYQVLGIEP